MDLRLCHLFQDLNNDQLNQIMSTAKEMPMEKGQILFAEGAKAPAFQILMEGTVELTMSIEENFDLPITMIRSPGYCFGIAALIPPYQYSLTAKCVEKGSYLSIETANLRGLIESDYELGCVIMRNLAQHFLERLQQTRKEVKIHFTTLFRSLHSQV